MMTSSLHPPLRPRSGNVLHVLGIVRVSKADKDRPKDKVDRSRHDEPSLEDQSALLRDWLLKSYGKAYQLDIIGSTGSGEFLEREESARANAAVESGRYDLVLTEDLGRIFRRVHAFLYCELCEDIDTRLIALNDGVDTGRDDWRSAAIFAVMRHEMYNRDTAARIRRTLRNRFTQGGVC
jgi:site-specific DNA recombinase